MAKAKHETVEAGIVQAFLKSVGAELGCYHAGTRQFKEGVEEEPLYQSNLQIVQAALKSGWKAGELEEYIFRAYQRGERGALLSEILPKKNPETQLHEGDNLLSPERDYHHPALYDRSAPRYLVATNGTSLVPATRGTNTRKSSFTLRELTVYYFDRMHVARSPRTWTAALGAFGWMLQESPVDEVLCCIDLAVEKRPDSPVIDLTRFLPEAQEEIRRRRGRAERV